jgi:hypothetical protein
MISLRHPLCIGLYYQFSPTIYYVLVYFSIAERTPSVIL